MSQADSESEIMRESPSDIQAFQQILKSTKPARSGLRLITARGDTVSLSQFYAGRSAFLVLSGPSLNQLDLEQLNQRGIVSMGVNNSWAVHRPNLWCCVDPPNRFLDAGWKDPGILKFIPSSLMNAKLGVQNPDGTIRESAFRVRQMPGVFGFRRADAFDHRTFLIDDAVHWGCLEGDQDAVSIQGKRSVMLVALRMLHYLGFSRVFLLGCDFTMSDEQKYAFDEGRSANAIKHNNALYASLAKRFDAMREHFKKHNYQVYNCSPGSQLESFERMQFSEAIELARAECGTNLNSAGWYEKREAVQR